ncbi:hypothetical protein POM88_001768 [Heracleum sosnowskyi]|uniref:Uncharacterized protein n=1 Tax=Heracleum sosnowskyi TaxID=360622 RepID=A0AAD8JFL1_9APIA|nr:hypothetical protein POM88_001768 [Heracleum sosnowskyi]
MPLHFIRCLVANSQPWRYSANDQVCPYHTQPEPFQRLYSALLSNCWVSLCLEAATLERVRNSSLIERSCAEDERALIAILEPLHHANKIQEFSNRISFNFSLANQEADDKIWLCWNHEVHVVLVAKTKGKS